MKRILSFGILASSLFFLASCSSDGGSETNYPQTYVYTEDGVCTTPTVTSRSIDELCRNLLDNDLNNFCAPEQRNAAYEYNRCAKVLGIADN